MTKIFFLHIPKTAGQTVHSELCKTVGAQDISPVRVHTQASAGDQFPEGYRLFSGHLDWTHLPACGPDRFAFTILRDPFERIASFYTYLRAKAEAMTPQELALPAHIGLKTIRKVSVDDYFFGGSTMWQQFILDHYDNFHCSYLAMQKMRGASALADLKSSEILVHAETGARRLDRIYRIEALSSLEKDIGRRFDRRITLTD